MTTRPIMMLAALVAASAASGCGTMSRSLGMTKVSPDEFRVVSQAPLTLPPDYSLRPPRPGEARPQELQPDQDARAALFGQDVAPAATQGERTLVTHAGAETVDPGIRDTIDFESQGVVRRNEDFVNRLLAFGGSGNANTAAPLDPTTEQQRLDSDEQIRRVTGGGTVTIERNSGFKLPGT